MFLLWLFKNNSPKQTFSTVFLTVQNMCISLNFFPLVQKRITFFLSGNKLSKHITTQNHEITQKIDLISISLKAKHQMDGQG